MRVSMRSVQLAGVLAILTMASSAAMADAVSDAKAVVEEYSKPNAPWNGPTTGPKAEPGKSIIYVSTDQRNGGALGAGEGVEEAAKKIGWKFTLIDGQSHNHLVRLNGDGSVDTTFNPNADNTVYSLALQTDGKLVTGGLFTTIDGQHRAGIARFSAPQPALN